MNETAKLKIKGGFSNGTTERRDNLYEKRHSTAFSKAFVETLFSSDRSLRIVN
jgi:hypothetical protein